MEKNRIQDLLPKESTEIPDGVWHEAFQTAMSHSGEILDRILKEKSRKKRIVIIAAHIAAATSMAMMLSSEIGKLDAEIERIKGGH